MWSRRLCYLAVLGGCGVYYLASGEWLSALLLAAAAVLPWLSLLLSLPAMLTFRVRAMAPALLSMEEGADAWLEGSSLYPLPAFSGQLLLRHCVSADRGPYNPAAGLPTGHCGGIDVIPEGCRVRDYLGLFSLPVRRVDAARVLVLPRELPLTNPPDLNRFLPRTWRPKPGGGFGENHEIRLYRPGDSLNQVHWKLTAKTGRLTVREPLVPQRGLALLTMTLRGTPQELDRKFGRLSWLGRQLARREVPFTLRVLTGEGILTFPVSAETELEEALHRLLCTAAAASGSVRDCPAPASWQYHIGGEADEP